MAGGGGQGASQAQAAPSVGQAALQGYNPQATTQRLNATAAPPTHLYQMRPMTIAGYADGGQIGLGNYASPNQSFMQYQGQGQPNQPNVLPSTQPMAGPDGGGDYAPANMGFDNSGSDGGVGGQPTVMQTPLSGNSATANVMAQGNKPLGLAQFQQPQGLQIAGNPTSQVVQRPQQR